MFSKLISLDENLKPVWKSELFEYTDTVYTWHQWYDTNT